MGLVQRGFGNILVWNLKSEISSTTSLRCNAGTSTYIVAFHWNQSLIITLAHRKIYSKNISRNLRRPVVDL
jgi:hypothetical protein